MKERLSGRKKKYTGKSFAILLDSYKLILINRRKAFLMVKRRKAL